MLLLLTVSGELSLLLTVAAELEVDLDLDLSAAGELLFRGFDFLL